MKDQQTVERFIELRVQGWPFSRIAAELNVSKPTLIAWSRKHRHQIQNLRAIEHENLHQQLFASSEERMKSLAQHLHAAETELAKRDLAALPTSRLLSHVLTLRRELERHRARMEFVSPVDEIPEDEYADRIQVWNA